MNGLRGLYPFAGSEGTLPLIPQILNPLDFESPDFDYPEFKYPDFESQDFESPHFESP